MVPPAVLYQQEIEIRAGYLITSVEGGGWGGVEAPFLLFIIKKMFIGSVCNFNFYNFELDIQVFNFEN